MARFLVFATGAGLLGASCCEGFAPTVPIGASPTSTFVGGTATIPPTLFPLTRRSSLPSSSSTARPLAMSPSSLEPVFWSPARPHHVQLARKFVKSVEKAQLESIDGSDGMFVMKDVVMLETGSTSDVVIRNVTRPFWQACIDEVESGCRRVCAFGNSGIGKTTCTPCLIQMLLEAKKTVVYHVRTTSKDGWIYEFVPGLADDDSVTTSVYPEQTLLSDIELLNKPDTYYVVDPGNTTDNCNPPAAFRPKVIIVAAPDARHWGGDRFFQRRGVARASSRSSRCGSWTRSCRRVQSWVPRCRKKALRAGMSRWAAFRATSLIPTRHFSRSWRAKWRRSAF